MLEALIFDFDGLVLDTEWPEFESWREIYQQYGVELTLETWLPSVGTGATTQVFSPYAHLETQLGRPLERDEVIARYWQRNLELIDEQTTLPGVENMIVEAKRRGLQLGVASSSPRTWVAGYLKKLGLLEYFEKLACGDEVAHTKPYPDLYLKALEQLGVQANQAIAFEDSLNGSRAAHQAGIFCVVVPNRLTQYLTFDAADLQLTSLAEISLDQLIEQWQKLRRT